MGQSLCSTVDELRVEMSDQIMELKKKAAIQIESVEFALSQFAGQLSVGIDEVMERIENEFDNVHNHLLDGVGRLRIRFPQLVDSAMSEEIVEMEMLNVDRMHNSESPTANSTEL